MDSSKEDALALVNILGRKKIDLTVKRAFDITASVAALLVLSPAFLVLALIIALDSPGKILFRQVRVGKDGKLFKIFKFRSMCTTGEGKGLQITVGGDSRITRSGKWLRKSKLDELPQLINILQGEMSFVGPRPEVPRYVEMYTPAQRQVLLARPGITDLASIKYRNESALLAASDNPERLYIETIMPEKLRLNQKYIQSRSFWGDIKLIFKTIGRLFV